LPVVLVATVLSAVQAGLEQWRRVVLARLIPPTVGLVGVVVLYLAGSLTVATGAAVAVVGSLAVLIPTISAARPIKALSFSRALARASMPFGLKACVGSLATLPNEWLDPLSLI